MWRLRNRLIVTYTFIGVIPLVLVLMMALIAGYLFAGQFATFLASSDLNSELRTLEAANSAMATELATVARVRGVAHQQGPACLAGVPPRRTHEDSGGGGLVSREQIELYAPGGHEVSASFPPGSRMISRGLSAMIPGFICGRSTPCLPTARP